MGKRLPLAALASVVCMATWCCLFDGVAATPHRPTASPPSLQQIQERSLNGPPLLLARAPNDPEPAETYAQPPQWQQGPWLGLHGSARNSSADPGRLVNFVCTRSRPTSPAVQGLSAPIAILRV